MQKPNCVICNLELEAGYQEITAEDLNFEMSGVDLLREDFGLSGGEESRKKQERKKWLKEIGAKEQVEFFMHNPNFPQQDILVHAHKECFEKAKIVKENLGKPTQDDHTYPIFDKKSNSIKLKKREDFIKIIKNKI